jgi:DNA-binding CsgD family transcriptional regulator
MTWTADYKQTAETVCTPNELTVLRLAAAGLSQRTIALHLRISRSAVQSRLENALRKIHAAQEKTNA